MTWIQAAPGKQELHMDRRESSDILARMAHARPTPPDTAIARAVEAALSSISPSVQGIACWVFGSRAGTAHRQDSDLDIALLCDRALTAVEAFDAAQTVAATLSLDVDLVDLRTSSGVLAMEVVLKGRRILCHDEFTAELFATTCFSEYVSFSEERAPIIDGFLRARKAV